MSDRVFAEGEEHEKVYVAVELALSLLSGGNGSRISYTVGMLQCISAMLESVSKEGTAKLHDALSADDEEGEVAAVDLIFAAHDAMVECDGA